MADGEGEVVPVAGVDFKGGAEAGDDSAGLGQETKNWKSGSGAMTSMVAPNLWRKAETCSAWVVESRATGSAVQAKVRRRRVRGLPGVVFGSMRRTLARGLARRCRVWAASPLT